MPAAAMAQAGACCTDRCMRELLDCLPSATPACWRHAPLSFFIPLRDIDPPQSAQLDTI